MKKLVAFITAAVATMSMATMVSALDAPSGEIDTTKFKVSWEDNFDGNELKRDNWEYQIGDGSDHGLTGWGNNELENYQSKNVTVSDGSLKIKAMTESTVYNGKNYKWTSGRITSAGKGQAGKMGYGYVEARIKIPSAQGIWPAFWMLGTNGKTWPANGEIDIMEAFNTRTVVQSTIHYPSFQGKDVYIYGQKSLANKTEWHTYGVYRDENIIAFYVDRKLVVLNMTWANGATTYARNNEEKYGLANIPSGDFAGDRSMLKDDFYLLFNVACGGNLAGGNPPTTADWSATMEVDYVKYMIKKTPEEIAADEKNNKEEDKTPQNTQPTVKKPAKVVITKAVNIKGRKVSLKFKKISGAKYIVRWCDNKKFDGYEQKKVSKASYVIKGLDKKSTCFIKVRAVKKANGKTLTGAWSRVKRIKIKK